MAKIEEEDKEKESENGCCRWRDHHHFHRGHRGGGAFYTVGFFGAAVYFIGQEATFGAVVIGLLKALVWPAFLVFYALKFFMH